MRSELHERGSGTRVRRAVLCVDSSEGELLDLLHIGVRHGTGHAAIVAASTPISLMPSLVGPGRPLSSVLVDRSSRQRLRVRVRVPRRWLGWSSEVRRRRSGRFSVGGLASFRVPLRISGPGRLQFEEPTVRLVNPRVRQA